VEDKEKQLDVTINEDVEYGNTLLSSVVLVHNSMPELNFDEITTEVNFFGKILKLPVVISAITGGFERGYKVMKDIFEVAKECGIAVSLGSQKLMLEDEERKKFYPSDRDVFTIANIGAEEILKYPIEDIGNLVYSLNANALSIHLNPAQELFYKGKANYRGVALRLQEIKRSFDFPVIVKETGCGISKECAKILYCAGVDCVDISGVGGTSWIIAQAKASQKRYSPFLGWGIPTAASLIEIRRFSFKKIASGGIRTGVDGAKCIALGADLFGFALPMLKSVVKGGVKEGIRYIEEIERELRYTMFLTGSRDIYELKKVKFVLLGDLYNWAIQRANI